MSADKINWLVISERLVCSKACFENHTDSRLFESDWELVYSYRVLDSFKQILVNYSFSLFREGNDSMAVLKI